MPIDTTHVYFLWRPLANICISSNITLQNAYPKVENSTLFNPSLIHIKNQYIF